MFVLGCVLIVHVSVLVDFLFVLLFGADEYNCDGICSVNEFFSVLGLVPAVSFIDHCLTRRVNEARSLTDRQSKC